MKITTPVTFNHATKEVTFTDYGGGIALEHVVVVTNTTRGIIIYNPTVPALKGTVATNVLTLNYDTTTGMADADKLWAIYDDPTIEIATEATIAAILTAIGGSNTSLASIDGKTPALGQALAAASVPVILPAATVTTLTPQTNALTDAQLRASAVPVSAAALPLPSGASTETTLGTRLSESDFDTKIGSLTETAPATDTASSGVNGRLQRLAQRVTSLIALFPTSLGQKTSANSLAVVVASDQSVLSVKTDQTTPGTTDKVSVSTGTGAGATIGTSTDAAVITDAAGTLQQYLRGLVSYFANLYNATTNFLLVRNLQKDVYANAAALTITLNSLASSTAGVGRQSTLLTSNTNRAAIVNVKLKMGTTPTAGAVCYVYLLMSDGTIATDSAGASDQGLTIANAKLLGVLTCLTATVGLILADAFDTRLVTPALGPQWGIAIVNSSGAALDASAGGTIDYTLVS